ncbi:MotA/TolQ/ExbB proton channel family protein [Alcaligenaceae bacterium]|uniref:motility protein A n=1 Tax=Parapusillimonas sp. JC17 TaxID=3445768 RepID=UPI0015D335EA|nr:MotA/TolQ/ExbB proton channel family protein [Alcaligenaceae bacterium]
MNPSTLIGIVASVVLLGAVLFFSAEDAASFIDLPSLGIVVIGTLAATFISYPLREVLRIFRLLGPVLRNERLHTEQDIDDLISISRLWMKDDIRKVEAALENVSNPFLKTGVQLVIDHTPEQDIIDLMQWRVSRLRARERAEAQLFRTMAGFAPAFGMLGTLVGLVNLLFLLGDGDMAAIGQQMALALMTTFYGILFANLLLKPVAVKLERRTEQRVIVMSMIMQGVSMMCQKRSPSLMRETLNSFMEEHEDEINDHQGRRAKEQLTEPAKTSRIRFRRPKPKAKPQTRPS